MQIVTKKREPVMGFFWQHLTTIVIEWQVRDEHLDSMQMSSQFIIIEFLKHQAADALSRRPWQILVSERVFRNSIVLVFLWDQSMLGVLEKDEPAPPQFELILGLIFLGEVDPIFKFYALQNAQRPQINFALVQDELAGVFVVFFA